MVYLQGFRGYTSQVKQQLVHLGFQLVELCSQVCFHLVNLAFQLAVLVLHKACCEGNSQSRQAEACPREYLRSKLLTQLFEAFVAQGVGKETFGHAASTATVPRILAWRDSPIHVRPRYRLLPTPWASGTACSTWRLRERLSSRCVSEETVSQSWR